MNYGVDSVAAYLEVLPGDRKLVIEKLRRIVLENLPEGFEESFGSGMIGYDVPLSRYPKGYHVDGSPLPFIGIASQKNHVAFYHMGIYADEKLSEWFKEEYAKVVPTKLDMGKSCIRMKNINYIPYDLIAELCTKMSVDEYIAIYESSLK